MQKVGQERDGEDILCKECETKKYRPIHPMEKYGFIAIHKEDCKKFKSMAESGYEV